METNSHLAITGTTFLKRIAWFIAVLLTVKYLYERQPTILETISINYAIAFIMAVVTLVLTFITWNKKFWPVSLIAVMVYWAALLQYWNHV